MKVSEHIALKASQSKRKARFLGSVEAVMITHERPGLLAATVTSFSKTAPLMPLTVFDDGSESPEKKNELRVLEGVGVKVVRLPRMGFIGTWQSVFSWVRITKSYLGGIILLEDDLTFAVEWADILRRMYEGAADLGFTPGMMSCFRVHEVPQNTPIFLSNVEAYQSMAHSFQVNLVPMEVFKEQAFLDDAAIEARRNKRGLDAVLPGLVTHRLGRTNFISMQSWIAHEGVGESLVSLQGYVPLGFRGYELVEELKK